MKIQEMSVAKNFHFKNYIFYLTTFNLVNSFIFKVIVFSELFSYASQ